MADGVVAGDIGSVGGVGDGGDDGGHLLLDDAVVGADRLFVVLEGDSEELVLQLQRLRQLVELRRRRRQRRGRRSGVRQRGGRIRGGAVAVGEGIHFHRGRVDLGAGKMGGKRFSGKGKEGRKEEKDNGVGWDLGGEMEGK